MADLLRPEIRDALWRGREAIAGMAIVLLALWLGLSTFGITRWVAGALGLAGLGLVWTGVQRWRFSRSQGGPGFVQVDERRLVYWGPLDGGTMDLDNLARLDLDPGAGRWLLTGLRGEVLAVPTTAQGSEALFDLFTALPGLRPEAMLSALERTEGPPVTLWRAPNVVVLPRPEVRRLR
ncbi:hypothetical protein [Rubellimicrobium roseum]|uniref:Uncharacterized protein n=1 Tax=Rubellimicrobium roseum TaxID=687525 RepID=A0A5C4NEN9_9RHOB|nr:hypothetical protein [Rubellimicrobium roseum]TNC72375.1 hypothetical protein FHG71_08270 [Rubellimicrobium roseum]